MPGTEKKKAQDRERMQAKRSVEAQIISAYYVALETALSLKTTPQGGLWNYGTAPTFKEQLMWKGKIEAADEILTALQLPPSKAQKDRADE